MFGLFLFTLKLVCSAFGCLLLLRAYMRFMCTPSNDPLYAFCYSLTEWAVRSASTFIKRRGNIDWPSIFVCYLVAVLYQFFHWLVGSGSFGIFPFILGSAVLVVYWAIELAMWIALAFCIFSWVNPSGQIYRVTSFLSYPFLAPFKKFIPNWRNLDLSALAFFILANIALAVLAPLT
ncbi:MAG: YggT family protein [Burkholderiales bacterium]|uniref:YggT family protein n=1 Tax=uncultured Turicimonas sp. TaxID=1918607 RepID=UPI001ED45C15|nr:YggT family protein [uncultured Turicimonas sp.]MBS4845840.1 YggT family protein [Burkholderiales bacterium]